jgi:DNA polymerase-3 subunit epsilon
MYAIVDIETTGGFSARNRIIEIAVVFHDGTQITGHYEKLINPGCQIPGFITGLTGIDGGMLADAPTFSEVSGELARMLEGKVFIAHNVSFDFNFVKEAFGREGIPFNPKRLCTVRMSRKIFPGLGSYSLGRLCESVGIHINDRHRALGDAWATAQLFGKLLKADSEGFITKALGSRGKELSLPPHISVEKYRELPQATGVYYFHDRNGQVIYVGKALNIRSRFEGHFTGKSKINLRSEIHDVSYELTGSELLALLLEAMEIKRLWPKYNRSLKVRSVSWGLYVYEDMQGYIRFQVSKSVKGTNPVYTFTNHSEAWKFLLDNMEKFGLCPKFCGIQKTSGACYDYAPGKCSGACCGKEDAETYNAKVGQFLEGAKMQADKILVRDKGRTPEEEAVLLFEDGFFSAFGFVEKNGVSVDGHTVMDLLKPVRRVVETQLLLRSYLEKIPKSNILYLKST